MATATKAKPKSRKRTPTVSVTVSTFDTTSPVYRSVRERQPAGHFSPLTGKDYRPGGSTPLYDALGRFITHLEDIREPGVVTIGCLLDESGSMMGNRDAVIDGTNEFVTGMASVDADPDSDGRVLAVVFTDGMENSSREVTADAARQMIERTEADGWTWIYLGANQDAWKVGGGLSMASSATYDGSFVGTQSALRYAGSQARSFVGDVAGYEQSLTRSANVVLDSHGEVTKSEGTP